MTTVYVSIGSNIDRERNMRAAIESLRARFGPVTVSSTYESESVGFAGDNFYNTVAAFDTDLAAGAVIDILRSIEAQQGRVRDGERFASRTLDIDLLLYGDLVEHSDTLDVPPAELEKYAFVLLPLSEIAPDLRHPETGVTFANMWRGFRQRGQRLWRVE